MSGGEIAEADNPSEIGSAHSFAQNKRSKGDVLALDECRAQAARRRSSLINRASGFTAANGSVPSISILISLPALRSRAGTDRVKGFLVSDARRRGNTDIEDRGEPHRAQVDGDLIDAHFDRSINAVRTARVRARGNSDHCLPSSAARADQPLLS